MSRCIREIPNVYRAEWRAFPPGQTGRRFKTVAECAAYLEDVLARYGDDLPGSVTEVARPLNVQNGRGMRSAVCERIIHAGVSICTFRLPARMRDELTLLHELAHCLQPIMERCDHGPGWAAIYLELVFRVMGEDAFTRLYRACRDWNVEIRPWVLYRHDIMTTSQEAQIEA